jgi:hypothetical protein
VRKDNKKRSMVNVLIYAQVEIDEIKIREEREHGILKLNGFFDYDFGIQINTFGGRHFAFHDNITLKKDPNRSDGFGTLIITYANRDTYIDSNPKIQFTTVVLRTNELNLITDNRVFYKEGQNTNCRLNKITGEELNEQLKEDTVINV